MDKGRHGLLYYGGWTALPCKCRPLGAVCTNRLHQLRAAIDATRQRDGIRVMLKRLFLEEGPHELRITAMFSSPEAAQDPRNHCVPLLDLIEISNTDQKLLVLPFLRPFNNPRFETYGEFVAFFTQICEVSSIFCSNL
jgi:hypothetical protein